MSLSLASVLAWCSVSACLRPPGAVPPQPPRRRPSAGPLRSAGWAMSVAGAVACAPPPLPEDTGDREDEPSIQILFPETRTDINVCPSFIVVVAIGGVEVVDFTEMPDNQAGFGHWHLYVNNEYKAATSSPWYAWDMGAGAEGPVIINAVLAENDHTEIDVSATAEFMVGEADCVGGGAGSGSGSVGEYVR